MGAVNDFRGVPLQYGGAGAAVTNFVFSQPVVLYDQLVALDMSATYFWMMYTRTDECTLHARIGISTNLQRIGLSLPRANTPHCVDR